MSAIADKTLREMEAGARALAEASGYTLAPEYMERIIQTQQRQAQLKRWESGGLVEIERMSTANQKGGFDGRTWVHVLDENKKRFTAFDDLIAEQHGGWPSEVMIANIALALQSKGII